MMRKIVAASLKFRLVVLAVAGVLLFFGIPQLGSAKVDILPEFTPPIVEVQTEALGLSAEEVEQLVTVPLEQDLLNGVAFLDKIESASLPGLSSVVMTFEPGTPLLDARQVVNERLAQAVGAAGLPQVADTPQMLQPLSTLSRVAMAKVSSESLSTMEMSVLARWVIVPRLLGVEGVANVAIWGFRDRQLQVLVDPKRLNANGLTVQDIVRTSGNALEVSPLTYLEASSPGTGGFIEGLNQRLQIFHEQIIRTPEQLAQVTVEDRGGDAVLRGGKPLPLGKVATVVEDHQPLIGDALCGGEECLLLVVEKFPQANTREVTFGVDEALAAMAPGMEGLTFDTSLYRPARYIDAAFGNIARALAIGGVILLLLLALFSFNWRTTLVSAVAIALSLTTTAIVLMVRDATINTMVVAGIVMALGAVIQDSVVDSGNMVRQLRDRRTLDGLSWPRLLLRSVMSTRSAMLFGSLIALTAIVPAFVMEGEAGAFLPSIATTYALAIAASMLVALTVVPAMTSLLLANASLERESPVARWLQGRYDALRTRLGAPKAAVAMFSVVIIAALASVPFLTTALKPSLKEADLLIHLQGQPGTSLPKMDEITSATVEQIRALPGVTGIAAQVGRAVTSDRIVNVNSGDIWVGIDTNTGDYDTTVEAIEEAVDDYVGDDAGLTYSVGTYSDRRVSDLLQRTDAAITVRVYGEEDAVLRSSAERVRDAIAGIPGVEEPLVNLPAEEPTVEIKVDLKRAQVHGVKPGDVRRTAAILLSGITVGNLFEEQKVFNVVVWGTPAIRRSVQDVSNLLVDTPTGRQVRLGQVADVRVVPNPTVIRHEASMTYLDVTSDVTGRSIAAVSADVDEAIKQVEFPLEYHAEVLGTAGADRAARGRTMALAIAAAFAILLLFQAAFGSWRLGLLAFLTLPMAVGGGLVATAVGGGLLSLGAVAGLTAIVGLASRELVLQIRHWRELEREGAPFSAEMIGRGTNDRLVPTVLTAAATLGVLVPFVAGGGAIGLEIVRPLAITLGGGVVSTLLLQLFVLPAAYLRFGAAAPLAAEDDDLLITLPEPEDRRVTLGDPEAVR